MLEAARGRQVTETAWQVPAASARRLASELRAHDDLVYAEPDTRMRRASAFEGDPGGWARAAVVTANRLPPAASTSIGIVDDKVDPTHPHVGPQTTIVRDDGLDPAGPHGTEVASAAAGAVGNGGVLGIFPGAPIVSYATDLTCGTPHAA